jgi:hypothetical protein
MIFKCIDRYDDVVETWQGVIQEFICRDSYYIIRISSRSTDILFIYGDTVYGKFGCMPDFEAGCHLSTPDDVFWNKERLISAMGRIDGITTAYALKALADKIL